LENLAPADVVDIQGLILDPIGRPVKNATIEVTGSAEMTLVTDADGVFLVSGVSRNGVYTITPEKNDFQTNGLNAIDLVLIQKHLLGKDPFQFPWQFIAADATNNVGLAVGDILLLLKLLLGKVQSLPSSPSWRFDPPQLMVSNIPPGEPVEVQIMAIKIGDLNNTVDPQK
jgi:hypothetical protein